MCVEDPPPYEEPKADMSKLPKYSDVAGSHGYQGHQGGHLYPGMQPNPHMYGGYQAHQGAYPQHMTGRGQQTGGMTSRVYVHQPMAGGMVGT